MKSGRKDISKKDDDYQLSRLIYLVSLTGRIFYVYKARQFKWLGEKSEETKQEKTDNNPRSKDILELYIHNNPPW